METFFFIIIVVALFLFFFNVTNKNKSKAESEPKQPIDISTNVSVISFTRIVEQGLKDIEDGMDPEFVERVVTDAFKHNLELQSRLFLSDNAYNHELYHAVREELSRLHRLYLSENSKKLSERLIKIQHRDNNVFWKMCDVYWKTSISKDFASLKNIYQEVLKAAENGAASNKKALDKSVSIKWVDHDGNAYSSHTNTEKHTRLVRIEDENKKAYLALDNIKDDYFMHLLTTEEI